MTDFVFDTEPLIAYLYDEPGAADVTAKLQTIERDAASGAISHATATELIYKIARLETGAPNQEHPGEKEFEVAERDLRILRGYGLSVVTPPWDTVARIKGAGGISLGDAYAAGLALDLGATLVVGADPEFDDCSEDLDLYRIRENAA